MMMDDNGFCRYSPEYHAATHNKDAVIQTYLNYNDADTSERDVFGSAKKGLFYNYSDRLYGELWKEGVDLAVKEGIKGNTARFYERILNHFHQTVTVDLQHIILGVNLSTGYSYLVFGYTYEEKEDT